MLLRHVLCLAGVATAAPSVGPTNAHNFTADNILAVASDVNNLVFRTYPTKNDYFLQGLIDDASTLAVSPIFWSAVMDYSRVSNETAFAITIFNAVEPQFDAHSRFVWDEKKARRELDQDVTNDGVARWGHLVLSASEADFHPSGLRADWLLDAQGVFDYLSAQWNNPEYKRGGGISSVDMTGLHQDGPYESFFSGTYLSTIYAATCKMVWPR